jgi:tRNA threonylcarbamoyladenosine biosynthesis protein TsaB
MAKGVCFGAGKPLIAVPTLQALALSVSERIREEALYCPMIDARRMEVYCQLFDAAAKPLSEVTAHIVTPESFLEQRTEKGGLLVFGNGAAKSRELFTEPGVHFAEVTPSARGLVKPAFKAFAAKKFEDTAYFEPFYLKNFVVNCSSKKIF